MGERLSISPDQLWSAAQEELRFQVSRPGYEAWLKNARLLTLEEDGGRAVIGVPTPLARDWVSDRYAAVIRETLSAILNREVEVDFAVQSASPDGAAPLQLRGEVTDRRPESADGTAAPDGRSSSAYSGSSRAGNGSSKPIHCRP